IALYGGAALSGVANPMKHVIKLEARILQIRELQPGACIGYGATYSVKRPTRLATLGLGYADGYLRSLSSRGEEPGPNVLIGGSPAPIVGRVSMDLITADVSGLAEASVVRGAWAEVIGEDVPLDMVAARAGTIGYEILTRLSRRAFRIYLEG
ncbi:MAG: alanine racemase, partial [Hyphomicrobiaceae bacterium]